MFVVDRCLLFVVCICWVLAVIIGCVVVEVCWSNLLSSVIGCCCSWLLSVVVTHCVRLTAGGMMFLVACH